MMNRIAVWMFIAVLFPLNTLGKLHGSSVKNKKPNIVLILVDDLGWKDLSSYGSTFYDTPNIDQLAEEGFKFTDAYAASPVCSPTRASLLTGKDPARLHLTSHIPGPPKREYAKLLPPQDWTKYLKMSEKTFGEAFEDAGYKTFYAGKWHLGRLGPEYHGFNKVIPDKGWTPDPEDPKHVNHYTNAALEFIEKNKSASFLLVISHNTVHVPYEAQKKLIKKYKRKKPGANGQNNPIMGAMIERLDDSVGKLVKKIKKLGIYDNTYIIFFSDNGGLMTLEEGKRATSNLPLRGGKSQLYEGGVRVPFIVEGPGILEQTKNNYPVISNDLYPTMLSLAGLPLLPDQHKDGINLKPLLTGKTDELDRNNLFWHYPHYHTLAPHSAVRSGNWKLIEHYENGEPELYNLIKDVGEQHNLVNTMPEKANELKSLLHNHLKRIGAQMPSKNPKYDPEKTGTKYEKQAEYDSTEFSQPEYLKMKKDSSDTQ